MSEKYIQSSTMNNGYGCSCCMNTWSDEEQVDLSDMMSFEDVLNKALGVNPYGEFGATIDFTYEDEDHYLYGYSVHVNREYFDIYMWIGDDQYPVQTKNKKDVSKIELVHIFQAYNQRKGGNFK